MHTLYGQRNDDLSQQVISSLDIKASDAFTNASNALTKAGEADAKADDALVKVGVVKETVGNVKSEADEASDLADKTAKDAALIGSLISGRGISDPQALIERLRQFSGILVDI